MQEIPRHRLPSGVIERLDSAPADPSPAMPAATLVLLRDGAKGPEALLLRRGRGTGSMPGAYVFPGGVVDPGDGDPRLLERAEGLTPGAEPGPEYLMAALRETLEECGVLLARDGTGGNVGDAAAHADLARWREALLRGQADLLTVVESLDVRLAAGELVYFAHWVTPVAVPRRYDTRFFLAPFPENCSASLDAGEMTDARWLTPAQAVAEFREERLDMVLPTVRTLESLIPFRRVEEALAAFRTRPVVPVLPRLVRTARGVGIVVDGGA